MKHSATITIFDEMRESLADIGNAVQHLAESYGRGLAEDPKGWKDKVCAEFPTVPPKFWTGIERVSEGRLLPEIVARGCDHLSTFARISISDQKRVLERGFQVWTGGSDHRLVPAHLAGNDILTQVVNRDGHILTIEEQAAAARERDRKEARRKERLESITKERKCKSTDSPETHLRWRADKHGILIITCPIYLDKSDIRTMLADLDKAS